MTDAAPPSSSRPHLPCASVDARDPRIDMLRGLSLLMIFVNHIPFNSFSNLTPRVFGFSDAAEMFVFLAGYSAWMRYPDLVHRQGWAAGLKRIGRRCFVLWGTQALLVCLTVLAVTLHNRLTGLAVPELEPLISTGAHGLFRVLTLQALPPYLDILPLYILLIAMIPALIICIRRSLAATLIASLALYGAATLRGWNLPNLVDPRDPSACWMFDPFTWQVVFVLGVTVAEGRRRGWRWLAAPPRPLRMAALAVLVYAALAMDPAHLWPALAARIFPPWALDEAWKTCAAPWRLVHMLALLILLLNARALRRFATHAAGRAVLACGRHSLTVFTTGCMLALLGRFAYQDIGISPALQLAVNGCGLGVQIGLARWLERRRVFGRFAAPKVRGPRRRVGQAGSTGLVPRVVKQAAAFGLGAAIFVGPGLAFTLRHKAPTPPRAFGDYFPPPRLAVDPRFRIVAFGSSSTHGFGASSPAFSYPAQLQKLLDARSAGSPGFDVVNRGIDGEDVSHMLTRIDDDILPRRPDLVVWQLGSNDAIHGATQEEFTRSLRDGIARIRAAGVPLILIGPQLHPDPTLAALFLRLNEIMLALSREDGLPMVDRYALMRRWVDSGRLGMKALVGADGLHMTDQGYALMAQAVFERIAIEVPQVRDRLAHEPAG